MLLKDFLDRLKNKFSGQYFGDFSSNLKWVGMELWWVRKYILGDDKKYINRKQSAKYDDFFVNIMEQDSDVNVDVFLDVNYNRNDKWDEIIIWLNDEMRKWLKVNWLFYYFDLEGNMKKMKVNTLSQFETIIDELWIIVSGQKMHYISHLSDFVDVAGSVWRKNIKVFVSDFLDISDDDSVLIDFWMKRWECFVQEVSIGDEGWNYI